MNDSNVLIVGAGQLGSRYLQGLSNVKQPLAVFVVDPSARSLDLARKRWGEVSFESQHRISFDSSINNGMSKFDLAIIATTANCRPEVVSSVADEHVVDAWILEKLLAQSSSGIQKIENSLLGQSKVWVNTPRRLMSWHKEIRRQILCHGCKILQARIVGGNWGLACNFIHYVDLMAWWTNSSINAVENKGLVEWLPSKRQGFFEVFGSITIDFQDGSMLELYCDHSDHPPHIEVKTSDGTWLIDEESGKATGPLGQEIFGQLSFQSNLTAPLVEQIVSEDWCNLPLLRDSASLHRPMLDSLLKHWNRSQSLQDLTLPIT